MKKRNSRYKHLKSRKDRLLEGFIFSKEGFYFAFSMQQVYCISLKSCINSKYYSYKCGDVFNNKAIFRPEKFKKVQ